MRKSKAIALAVGCAVAALGMLGAALFGFVGTFTFRYGTEPLTFDEALGKYPQFRHKSRYLGELPERLERYNAVKLHQGEIYWSTDVVGNNYGPPAFRYSELSAEAVTVVPFSVPAVGAFVGLCAVLGWSLRRNKRIRRNCLK